MENASRATGYFIPQTAVDRIMTEYILIKPLEI
jgi:hypothetical protein